MTSHVIITGANGFVGRACVAEARRRKLVVMALYRSTPDPAWADDAKIHPVQADLTNPDSLQPLLDVPGHAVFIHAAGSMSDDPAQLALDNITATGFLPLQPGQKVVLISSLAVYDTGQMSPGDTLDENSPILDIPAEMDSQVTNTIASAPSPYALAKRVQEFMIDPADRDLWILRPGAIWGPGRSWHALMGFWASKLHVTIGSDGELPLCHVEHVARAAVEAACTPANGARILNVFDDDRPTRKRFLRAHRRCYGWPRFNITVPYGLWLSMIRLLKPVSGKLPGLFREPILRARMMPLRYPNTRLRSAFRGEDIDTFEGMMTRTRDAE